MPEFDDARRVFLVNLLAAGGLAVLGGSLTRAAAAEEAVAPEPAPPAAPPAPRPAAHPTVWEIHFAYLRNDAGKINDLALQGFALVAAGALTGEHFPLDGLEELFPEDATAAVLVDARSGTPRTRAIASKLAASIAEVATDAGHVRILDASDEDLLAGGYEIKRRGGVPLCHGTRPSPGFGAHLDAPMTPRGPVAFSKAAASADHLAVVASLGVRIGPPLAGTNGEGSPLAPRGRMAPFVIDAALRILEERDRKLALEDPALGARILASPAVSGRITMVIGEAVEMPLADADERAPSSAEPLVWKADEVIAGSNLFAVERIGHRILSSSRAAHGLPPIDPHPILVAAETAGIDGASMASIAWKKGAL